MRLIVRAERPHPAQLRITDRQGNRLTALATNTPRPARRPGASPPPGPGRDRLRAKDTPPTCHCTASPPTRSGSSCIACPGPHRLGADARPGRTRRPPVGAQTPAAAPARPQPGWVRTGRRQLLRFNCSWPQSELSSGPYRLRVPPPQDELLSPAPTSMRKRLREPVDLALTRRIGIPACPHPGFRCLASTERFVSGQPSPHEDRG